MKKRSNNSPKYRPDVPLTWRERELFHKALVAVVNIADDGRAPSGAQIGKSIQTTQRLIAEAAIRCVNMLKMCRRTP